MASWIPILDLFTTLFNIRCKDSFWFVPRNTGIPDKHPFLMWIFSFSMALIVSSFRILSPQISIPYHCFTNCIKLISIEKGDAVSINLVAPWSWFCLTINFSELIICFLANLTWKLFDFLGIVLTTHCMPWNTSNLTKISPKFFCKRSRHWQQLSMQMIRGCDFCLINLLFKAFSKVFTSSNFAPLHNCHELTTPKIKKQITKIF